MMSFHNDPECVVEPFGRGLGVCRTHAVKVYRDGIDWHALPSESKKLREGLRVIEAPNLPRGYAIRCIGCHCSVTRDHVPMSPECEVDRDERARSQSD